MWWNGCASLFSGLRFGNWLAMGGLLMMILIVAALVVGAVFFLRRFSAPGTPGPSASLAVLRQRYARGEISREQFEEMQETLRR